MIDLTDQTGMNYKLKFTYLRSMRVVPLQAVLYNANDDDITNFERLSGKNAFSFSWRDP